MHYRNTTALITGASSGIGKEFATQLAKRGTNLILVARRRQRLTELAQSLEKKFSIKTEVFVADLALPNSGKALHTRLQERGITIQMLINNAGFGTHGDFTQENMGKVSSEIQLNITTLVEMSHAFLPELLQAPNGATLINLASTAAFQPTPHMAIYGATKAFVLNFTEALAYETKNSKLKVLALCPGPTSTEFFDVLGENLGSVAGYQSAQQVVAVALKALERKNVPPSVVSGFTNKLTATTVKILPRSLALHLAGKSLQKPTK